MIIPDRRRFLVGATSLLAAPFVSRGLARAAANINLAWDKQVIINATVPRTVAYAKDAGVNLDLVGFVRGLDGMIALQKGDAQAAIGLVNFFTFALALSRDIDLTYVSGGCRRLFAINIAPRIVPEEQIDKKNAAYVGEKPWEVLRGKKVAAARGSQPYFALEIYLRNHGLDIQKDIEFLDMKSNADQALALQQGSIDAAVLVEPISTRARLGGYAVLLDFPYRGEDDFIALNSGAVVRTDLLKSNPELVQTLVNGHVQSINFYNAHPAAWVADTAATTLIEKDILAHVMMPEAVGVDPKYWRNVELNYQMPHNQIVKLAETCFKNGLIEKDVTGILDQHLDYSFLKKATSKSLEELGG